MTARTRILPMPEPFGLRRTQAAAYVGLGISTFNRAVEKGAIPKPTDLAGIEVWSRTALERALDPEGIGRANPWDE